MYNMMYLIAFLLLVYLFFEYIWYTKYLKIKQLANLPISERIPISPKLEQWLINEFDSKYVYKILSNIFFKQINPKDISKNNLHSVLYLIYKINSEKSRDIIIKNMEKNIGTKFKDNNKNQKFASIQEMEIKPSHKPLLYYFFLKGIKLIFDYKMINLGYKINIVDGLTYYEIVNKSKKNGKTCLYFHGLGFGLMTSFNLLKVLTRKYDNIFCPVMPNISNMVFSDFQKYNQKDFVKIILSRLTKNGYSNLTFIGHSFGTINGTTLINNNNNLFQKFLLIDPICFFPKHIHAFKKAFMKKEDFFNKYENHKYINKIKMSHYIIYKDIYVQQLLFRKTSIEDMFIYNLDLDERFTIVLGTNDHLISSHKVSEYIKEKYPKAKVIYLKNFGHGEFIDRAINFFNYI